MAVSANENISSSGGKISLRANMRKRARMQGMFLVGRSQVEALLDRLTKFWYATTKSRTSNLYFYA
jgi:hypothetical protein